MLSTLLTNVLKSFLRNGEHRSCRFYSVDIKRRSSTNVDDTMPKDKEQMTAMHRHREKYKKKTEGYASTRISLQVLGSGARGAPRCLYVSTDHAKYLFNCGEGTQRISHEHHLRLIKMENIFLTSPSWRNLGGLPGMALTVQENGVPHIRLHGPKGCRDLITAIQRFVSLKDLKVSEAVCKADEPFVDSAMTVHYVPLYKAATESPSNSEEESVALENVDYYAYAVNQNGKRSSSQERNRRKIPRTEDLIIGGRIVGSMAYICKLPPKRGTLLLDKCVDKGVKPGPLLSKLKAGEDISLPDGTVVYASDVCSSSEPAPIFIVVECPDEEYLDSLLNCEAFVQHQASASEQDIANCVVHFTPEEVLQNPRYREWMERFAPATRHMLINGENRCTGSEAIYRIQHKLHLLHPTIFPFLNEEGITVDDRPAVVLENIEEGTKIDEKPPTTDQTTPEEFPLISRVKTLDAVHLRPLKGFDTSAEIVLTPRIYIDETFVIDGFLDALAELQTKINARTKSLGEVPEYPKIVMLGTGSCIPSKTRNTSGILLRVDEDNSIILDCGEGTAGQLVRFYGRTEVDKVLATIKVIYVSHLHADHHLGLIGLLEDRARVTDDPVMLLAPEQIAPWLRIYNRRFEKIEDKFELFPNNDLDILNPSFTVSQEIRLNKVLQGVKYSTVRVKHCLHSFGVAITLENGCKIVYSGDTMPCDALVDLGKDCDLLIHEATMEDNLENEAKAKFHSTISQAIDIGERMKAKFTLLTHFSQRYSKLPHLSSNEGALNLNNVGIAYDNMQISLSQLPLLPLMYPALNVMFNEFRMYLEEKAMKRQMRTEWKKTQEGLHDEQARQKLP